MSSYENSLFRFGNIISQTIPVALKKLCMKTIWPWRRIKSLGSLKLQAGKRLEDAFKGIEDEGVKCCSLDPKNISFIF